MRPFGSRGLVFILRLIGLALFKASTDGGEHGDRVAQRFPPDRDVVGVNFDAIMADQSLSHGARHSRLVLKRCRCSPQAVKRKRIDREPRGAAAVVSTIAVTQSLDRVRLYSTCGLIVPPTGACSA